MKSVRYNRVDSADHSLEVLPDEIDQSTLTREEQQMVEKMAEWEQEQRNGKEHG
jgi:hypothetical protein